MIAVDSQRETHPATHPARWVPTLYFAEGVPYFAVSLMAALLYKRLGISNDIIALTTSWLLLPWSLKPLWSPLLELAHTKKRVIVAMEILGGLILAATALSLPLQSYFTLTIACFAAIAFCSATHDIVADGLYISSLSPKEQALYAGWQGGFYNVARFFSQGGLIILAGALESRIGVRRAWMWVFVLVGVILTAVGLYHARVLPSGETARGKATLRAAYATVEDVIVTFFLKPRIWLLLVFIFLYRAGEGQVTRIGPLFLVDPRSAGGLGLTTQQFGTIYGTFGTVAFIAGSVFGGYFASRVGLRRALFPLVCTMNLPNLAYVYLSVALPTNPIFVTIAMSLEMFGYGFGFVGLIVLMMQAIAPGPYPTAHYAFATALMNFGVLVPGAVSGSIQLAIGYRNFFVWVLLSAAPAVVLSRFLPIPGGEPASNSGATA